MATWGRCRLGNWQEFVLREPSANRLGNIRDPQDYSLNSLCQNTPLTYSCNQPACRRLLLRSRRAQFQWKIQKPESLGGLKISHYKILQAQLLKWFQTCSNIAIIPLHRVPPSHGEGKADIKKGAHHSSAASWRVMPSDKRSPETGLLRLHEYVQNCSSVWKQEEKFETAWLAESQWELVKHIQSSERGICGKKTWTKND